MDPSVAESLPSWSQIGSGLIGAGFAVWYAWHTTTKTIPDLNANNASMVREINDKHEKTIIRLMEEFRAEAKEQRAAESSRAVVSAELARSGHGAMANVTAAVTELRHAIDRITKE